MTILEELDAAVAHRVLVFGSLPPGGRDLDLLARPAEAVALREALTAAGFVNKRSAWARFRDCDVEVVEVVAAERWRLPDDELRAVFEQATPVEGLDRLVAPAPHHALLVLARRLARDGRWDVKRRSRVATAVAAAPDVAEEARARAPVWRAELALELLLRSLPEDRPPPVTERARAVAEDLGGGPTAAARAWKAVAPRPAGRGGAVVAFSGLDGAGKSSQATALRDALDRLGYDAVIEWTRLTHNPSLDVVARPVKRVLSAVRRRGRNAQPPAEAAGPTGARTPRRSRGRVLDAGWTTFVALANAMAQRRATAPHLRAGRVVICDRYTLDSAAHLRRRYGPDRGFRFQIGLIRMLSPRPLRAYHLEVRPETSMERKKEHYTLDDLRLHARMYAEERERLGVRRLDGERRREDLCALIAADVWRALR